MEEFSFQRTSYPPQNFPGGPPHEEILKIILFTKKKGEHPPMNVVFLLHLSNLEMTVGTSVRAAVLVHTGG